MAYVVEQGRGIELGAMFAQGWVLLLQLPQRLAADDAIVSRLETVLDALAQTTLDTAALQAVRDKLNNDQPLEDATLETFRTELASTRKQAVEWRASLQSLLDQVALIAPPAQLPASTSEPSSR